jgi:hypothetical protein
MVDQASDVRSLEAPIESFLHTLSGSTIHVMPDLPRQARQSPSSPTIPVKPDNPCEAIPVKLDLPRPARHNTSCPTIHVMPDNPRHARQSTSCPTIPVMPDKPCEAYPVKPDIPSHARQSTSGPTYPVKSYIHAKPSRLAQTYTSLDLDNLLWYHGLWQHEPLKVISTCVRLRQPMLLAEDELALAQSNRLIGKVELGPAQLTTRLSHLTSASQKLYEHPVHPVHLRKSNRLPNFCVTCNPLSCAQRTSFIIHTLVSNQAWTTQPH